MSTFKISTWNINSINARIEHLLNWLQEEKPDIVLLQELKCINEKFPTQLIEDLGYNIAINGQKTYNGVAILSKYPLTDISTNFTDNPIPQEARYIEAWVNFKAFSILVASVYVPNGQSIDSDKFIIKLEFLTKLKTYYQKLLEGSEIIVVGGDFNVALNEMDVYNPGALEEQLLFSIQERKHLRQFIASGFVDSYRMINHDNSNNCYTWWDYRANAFRLNLGMRIDYLFCSTHAAQINTDSFTSIKWRGMPRPSDHIPVSAVFKMD